MARLSEKNYDVCVIGGGISGALVAYKLGLAGVRVVVIEAGPRHPISERPKYMERLLAKDNPWASNFPERDVYTNGGDVEYPLNIYRVKGVGGSTLHWAGYTPRMRTSDFRLRSHHGIGEDWPISYDVLEPYYCEAEAELGVAGAEDNPFASPRSKRFPLPQFPVGYDEDHLVRAGKKLGILFHSQSQARNSVPYRGRSACATFSVCTACPILAKYSGDIHIESAERTGNVKVLENAHVRRLELGEGGRIKSAVYVGLDRSHHEVHARVFVVAAHAVESARLLLLSEIANFSGLVGKYFMEHEGHSYTARFHNRFFPYRKGFLTVLSEQFADNDKRDSEAAFLIRGQALGPKPAEEIAREVILNGGNWGKELDEELSERLRGDFGRYFRVSTNAEPLPSANNRIELDPKVKDAYGDPCPKIFYSKSEYENEAFKKGRRLALDLLNAMGAEAHESEIRKNFGGHQSGTCRMGNDPRTSVVDQNLRTHDIHNLYIVGSSVFPTIGSTNPTLTIAALALRLADHIYNVGVPRHPS